LFDDPTPVAKPYPGRMAAVTALDLTLIGASLSMVEARAGRFARLAELLAVLAMLLACAAVLAYVYDADILARVSPYTSIALHTAIAFVALGIGVLMARRDGGLLQSLARRYAGGAMARRLPLETEGGRLVSSAARDISE